MCKNQIVIFLFFFFTPLFLFAQCIDSKTLRDKLIFIQNPSGLSPAMQLQELLKYETAAAHCSYRADSVRILLLEHISKLYVKNADYKQAVYYTLRAINIVANNLQSPLINSSCQITNYYNLAVIYDLLKKTSEKIGAYDSCIIVAKRIKKVNLYFLYSLLEKVKYLNNVGDYDLCISQADLGETFSRQYEIQRNKQQDNSVSASYSLAFATQKANALLVLQKADKAETLLLSKMKACNTKNAKDFFGVINEELALAKMQQKKYNEALGYFNQALISYKAQKDMLSYKCITHNIGFLYDDIRKDDNKALYFYKKAIGIKIDDSNRNELDSINSLNIYSNIGNLYARRFQFDSAQYYFQLAFNLIKKGTNETEVLQSSLDDFIRNQKVEYLTGLFINKGNAFYKQYLITKNPVYVSQAIRIFKLTDRLLERIKANQLEIQSKLFWRKITHPFYEEAIQACIKAGESEEAFYFFERSRAILLYDEMKEQRGFSKADILKQQKLRNNINDLQQQLTQTNPDSPDFEGIQNEISGLKDAQHFLLQQIKVKNPLYFSNFLDSNFARLKETRQTILNGHALVEIFTGDSGVYSMIVTNKDIYFNSINKADYDSTILRCLSYMSDYTLVNIDVHFHSFIKNSRHLYNLIFQGKKLPDGAIIFSEDGQHFPFETLVINSAPDVPVYFIQEHPVSYTYSARFLMNQFSQDPSFKPGNFLGIAPVKFPSQNHLQILPGSDEAIRDVASMFTFSDTLLRENGTRNNFITKFGQYQVIQLFTHSSDASARGEPVLYFADKPLYLSELSNIKTSATKLVVLSACETGNGTFYKGEGVFSFNRAFAALGIPSCINNLWSVDNESTYKLSKLFYNNISKGLSVDEALQLAKLEYIKTSSPRKQSPYYWAATILSGKAEAIQFKENKPDYLKISMVVIAISASLLLLIAGIRKSNK